MSWSKLRMLGYSVLVRLDPREAQIGSIIVPDLLQYQPESGTVVAVGPGYADKHVPIDVRVGDRVRFGKWNGTPIDAPEYDPDGEYFVMSCDPERKIQDVYGVEVID